MRIGSLVAVAVHHEWLIRVLLHSRGSSGSDQQIQMVAKSPNSQPRRSRGRTIWKQFTRLPASVIDEDIIHLL
jgi:hypothetical protein